MAEGQRNKRTELLDSAARLPWWVHLSLALVAFLALHTIAGLRVAPARNPGAISAEVAWQLLIFAAGFLQYLLPMLFVVGAVLSAWRQIARPGPEAIRREPMDSGFPRLQEPDDPDPARNPAARRPGEARLARPWQGTVATAQQGGENGGAGTGHNPDTWTLDLLRALEWKRFEAVCAALCAHLGFEARTERQGADGGVDMHLFRPGKAAPAAVVQCKSWNTYRIGVKPVRELLGVMTAAGVTEGIFMTTATFTREALDFGRANGIDCMDGPALIDAIRTLPEAAQRAMLVEATAGDYLTPTCATCGIKLVKREKKADGEGFWGCSNYPKCRLTMGMR